MTKIFISIVLFTLSVGFARAQDTLENSKNWPLVIGIGTHSYSWPFYKSITSPMQPSVLIGTEYNWRKRNGNEWLQTFNLGYFHNPDFVNVLYLNSFFKYRHRFKFNLFLDGGIGAGYIHRIHARETFTLNENGDYETTRDLGSPGVMLGFNLSAGYQFKIFEKDLDIFLLYDWYVNYPHAKDNVPIIANSIYHLGFRLYLFK